MITDKRSVVTIVAILFFCLFTLVLAGTIKNMNLSNRSRADTLIPIVIPTPISQMMCGKECSGDNDCGGGLKCGEVCQGSNCVAAGKKYCHNPLCPGHTFNGDPFSGYKTDYDKNKCLAIEQSSKCFTGYPGILVPKNFICTNAGGGEIKCCPDFTTQELCKWTEQGGCYCIGPQKALEPSCKCEEKPICNAVSVENSENNEPDIQLGDRKTIDNTQSGTVTCYYGLTSIKCSDGREFHNIDARHDWSPAIYNGTRVCSDVYSLDEGNASAQFCQNQSNNWHTCSFVEVTDKQACIKTEMEKDFLCNQDCDWIVSHHMQSCVGEECVDNLSPRCKMLVATCRESAVVTRQYCEQENDSCRWRAERTCRDHCNCCRNEVENHTVYVDERSCLSREEWENFAKTICARTDKPQCLDMSTVNEETCNRTCNSIYGTNCRKVTLRARSPIIEKQICCPSDENTNLFNWKDFLWPTQAPSYALPHACLKDKNKKSVIIFTPIPTNSNIDAQLNQKTSEGIDINQQSDDSFRQ